MNIMFYVDLIISNLKIKIEMHTYFDLIISKLDIKMKYIIVSFNFALISSDKDKRIIL